MSDEKPQATSGVGQTVEGWDDGREAEPSVKTGGVSGGGGRRAKARRGGAGPRPPRKRRGLLAALILVVVVIVGGGALVRWLLFAPVVSKPAGNPVQLKIAKGVSTTDIGEKLAKAGVIDNPLMFRLIVRFGDKSGPLKAGVYDMTTGMGYDKALALLRAGPTVKYFTLAIPEGWTIERISQRVEEKAGIPASEFSNLAKTGASQFDYPFLADNKTGSLEGYLFPKTYQIKVGSSAHDIIDKMLEQFGREISAVETTYPRSKGMSMHDLVTLASMIERETRVDRDRPLVSSVIYNRLARGMFLEIDATVQYIVGNKPRLLYRDLRVNSPYNTYMHKGLPPGPIANPGLECLKAAASPAKTSYLYYVLTRRDGSHSFAATSEQFQQLKAQARKGLK